jgi:hypothetical protein
VRLKDIVELVRVDMPDYTEGAFDVMIKSDDGGSHITIYIEDHTNSQKILNEFSHRFKDSRIIVAKVPEGYLGYLRPKDKDKK